MADRRIMIFLNEDCLNIPTKKPKENRAGMVLTPKMNMTKAPESGLPVLVAMMAKE